MHDGQFLLVAFGASYKEALPQDRGITVTDRAIS